MEEPKVEIVLVLDSDIVNTYQDLATKLGVTYLDLMKTTLEDALYPRKDWEHE